MKLIFALALVAIVLCNDVQQWTNFTQKYNKQYVSATEESSRFA
ncbi:hypothetical protein KIPB_012082, partial [Kipferlia bialata]|eukprot:g12082.t1